MAMEAWFMEENHEDPRLPHHRNPKEFVSLDHLADLGVLYWKLNPDNYEDDEELKKIRESRGYSYMDMLDLCPEKVEDYEGKLKKFYTEHIHGDEEIRYCVGGSGYFDVRDKDDRWIRIWIKPGDLIVLPAGIYHRFTVDAHQNYVKLMRLFVGEPVWTSYNRPQEDHPARKGYIKTHISKHVSTKFSDVLAFRATAPERINGRPAMVGFVAAMVVELSSGHGLLAQILDGGAARFVATSVALSLVPLFKGACVQPNSEGAMSSYADLWNGRLAVLGLVGLAFTEFVKGGALVYFSTSYFSMSFSFSL